MSSPTYPVRVDATLSDHLSRWLWLVKWLLAVPHYLVLALLWIAFLVLSAVALVAILFTGHYPRGIFDFNVGVLRWTWRVAYYTYGGLGTDQYPPFSLQEVPDYPAHLEVEYPRELSRGLVLVKWWLLAIPHYVVVAIFMGSGWYVVTSDRDDLETAGGGLIGLLVLIAAVVLLFTGRYPRPIFDLVLGLNRWVLRVAAYVALMTDAYPPFRLDMGGTDPGTGVLTLPRDGAPPAVPAAAPPAAPAAAAPTETPTEGQPAGAAPGTPPTPAGPAAPGGPPAPTTHWGAGRVIAVVLGALLGMSAFGLLAAGGVARLADTALRDDAGYLMSSSVRLESTGYAVTSQSVDLNDDVAAVNLPERWLGTVKVEADGHTGSGVFIGIARTSDADAYLAGVAHSLVVDPAGDDGDSPEMDFREGGAPATSPTEAGIWEASAAGEGKQTVTWSAEEGDWTLVVMSADGSSPVRTDVAVGATAPGLDEASVVLLVSGLVVAALAALVLVLALRRRPVETARA
jgi:hypothetical protein